MPFFCLSFSELNATAEITMKKKLNRIAEKYGGYYLVIISINVVWSRYVWYGAVTAIICRLKKSLTSFRHSAIAFNSENH